MRRISLLLATLAAVGCGEPRYYPVRGVVLDEAGAPLKELAGATIEFEAVSQAVSAVGEIQPDGRFVMTSESPDDGCLPGEHRVVIGPVPIDGDRGRVQVIDPAYAKFDTSKLTVTVAKSPNDLPIRVKRFDPDAAAP